MTQPAGVQEVTSFPEELQQMGVDSGMKIDIRDLAEIRNRCDIAVYLYFEEQLARESTLQRDLEDYGDVPEFERPFIRMDAFLEFAGESDPAFNERLDQLPLIIEIVAYGRLDTRSEGRIVPYVKGLMPFLDELAMDEIPA
jgi:hypothetical protein